jgi:peroxiredoxin
MKKFGLALLVLSVGLSYCPAQQNMSGGSLRVGDAAPDFALPYATKDTILVEPKLKLSDMIGKNNVVLAFYPADWSSGCTKEVCTIRDNFSQLEKLNAEILAISGDYVFSHREWARHHNLPFKLLSDHDHAVAKRYDSYNEVFGYNKRTVYVVDRAGKIAYINLRYSVRTDDDFQKLQAVLASLQ